MKRFLAIALTLCLALALPAFAESIEATRIDWDESAEQVFLSAGYSGTWYTLNGVGCKLIIPDGYVEQELTEQDRADECAFWFNNAENGGRVQVYDSYIESCDDLVTLGNSLREQHPERPVQYALINGMGALLNTSEEYDMTNAIFYLGEHRFIQIMFSPMSQSTQLLTLCLASIQFQPAGE